MKTFAIKQPINDFAKLQKKGDKEGRSHSISPLSTGMPLLQRQCACGGGCPRCKEELGIQTKLKISEPGDKYEQEADRIANEVMRMPEPSLQRQVEPKEENEVSGYLGNLTLYRQTTDEDDMTERGRRQASRQPAEAQRRERIETPVQIALREAYSALTTTLERSRLTLARWSTSESDIRDVRCAYQRFFPSVEYQTPDYFREIIARIQAVQIRISTIGVYEVQTYPLMHPNIPDEVISSAEDMPAFSFPLDNPTHIVLLPNWYQDRDLRVTRIIHEAFHIVFPHIRHTQGSQPRERPHEDAFAYQGFVSTTARLSYGRGVTDRFPEIECRL